MKERPILFSAPMVRAILSGSKSQTRRVVKPQPDIVAEGGTVVGVSTPEDQRHGRLGKSLRCPYGQPGDRLWVRETIDHDAARGHFYKATGMYCGEMVDYEREPPPAVGLPCRAIPSIHMPRWASRITLAITAVRVERLQDISEADAIAEGIEHNALGDGGYSLPDGSHYHATDPRISYWSLWDAINGAGSAQANPWLWAVEFRRVAGGSDAPSGR